MKEFSQLIWDQTRPVTLVYYETLQNNFRLQNSGFFLRISKEIGKEWRKSLTRAKRASLTRP